MRLVSSVVSAFVIILMLLSPCVSAVSDNALWEDSEVYNLFDEGESNCSLNFAVAKVKYDYPSNRIHILFMMSFDSFTDENNVGVEMNFNDLGTILLMADETAEYNENVYFAQIDDIDCDSRTATVYIETTIGIKKGIPKELEMEVSVFDTEGVRSNEYSLDISDCEEETTTTSKEKTTKTKTTKSKTTKVKTTKVKTTQTKKSSSTKTTEKESEKSYATLNNRQMDNRISSNSNGKRNIAIAVIAVAVGFIAAGCVVGIKKSGKPKQ